MRPQFRRCVLWSYPALLLPLFTISVPLPAQTTVSAEGSAANPMLRIGLIRQLGGMKRLSLFVSRSTVLRDEQGETHTGIPSVCVVTAEPSGRVVVTDVNGNILCASRQVRVEPPTDTSDTGIGLSLAVESSSIQRATLASRGGKAATVRRRLSASETIYPYRGTIEVRAGTKQTLQLINTLPLEAYLRGVIASEMPSESPADALRAQAVAARTYALKVRGKYRAEGYDLTDTTACQVYGGMKAEEPATDAAIRDTAGLVLTRGGQLIEADFYDDCGGVTSPGEDPDDYPPSIRDAPNKDTPDYCARGTYHVWTFTLTPQELSTSLQPLFPGHEGMKTHVTGLEVTEADSSGRAKAVRITWGKIIRVVKGSELRRQIGYEQLKSALFMLSRSDTGAFEFKGRGYGHGHGLCQWGAIGMASAPYGRSYRDILTHYYPGTVLAPYTDTMAASQTIRRGTPLSSRHTMHSLRGTRKKR